MRTPCPQLSRSPLSLRSCWSRASAAHHSFAMYDQTKTVT